MMQLYTVFRMHVLVQLNCWYHILYYVVESGTTYGTFCEIRSDNLFGTPYGLRLITIVRIASHTTYTLYSYCLCTDLTPHGHGESEIGRRDCECD